MSKKSKRNQPAATNPAAGSAKTTITVAGNMGITWWMIILVSVLPVLFYREAMDPTLMIRYIFLAAFMFLFVLFFFMIRKYPLLYHIPLLIKIVFGTGLAFCIWSSIGLSAAINPVAGYYEILRQLMNLLLLFVVMLMAGSGKLDILKLCKTLVLVSVLHAFVGILQFYGIAFTDLPAGAHELPYGLMSNRNLFGSAQALLLPFSIYVLYKGSRNWKIMCSVALVLTLVSILLSQTRSAWLSTMAVIGLPFVLVMIFSAANRKKWLLATVAGLAITASFTWLIIKTDTEGSLSASVSQRAASLSTAGQLDTSTSVKKNINERLMAWNKTIAIIKDHPVTGVGYGNWKLVVPAYGTEGMVWAKGLIIPDRPHNVYLQMAAETGIPGAVLFFSMWGLVAVLACITVFRPANEDQRILAIVMLAGLAAFAVDCMFSFPVERIEHSLYLALMGGIILGSYNRQRRQDGVAAGASAALRPFGKMAVAGMMVLLAANIFMGYKKINYEIHMNYAKAYEDKKRYQEELQEVEAGQSSLVNLDPNGSPLEARAGIAYRGLKDSANAIASFSKAATYNPNSPMIYNNMGTVYTESGDFKKAIEYYNRALKLAPEFDIVMKNLAMNYFNTGKYDSCIIMLNKAGTNGDANLNNFLLEAKRRMELEKK